MDSVDPLIAEYNTYLSRQRFINETLRLARNEREEYELRNILCRFLLSLANQEDLTTIKLKAISELVEKKLTLKIPFHLLDEIPNAAYPTTQIVRLTLTSFPLPEATRKKLLAKSTPENMCRVILRYEGVLCRTGSFWGLTPKVWQHLEQYKVKYEGFASPLNCNLDTFFSIFPDIDAVYGSQGSFLTAQLPPGVYCANPPYVESIMISMTERILTALTETDYTFFLLLPHWLDSPPIMALMQSEYLRTSLMLPVGHRIYDYLRGKVMTAKTKNLFLVISNTDIKVDANKLRSAFY